MRLEYPSFLYEHYKIYPRLGDMDFEKMTCIDFGCGDYRSDVAKQVLEIPFKELTSIEGYEVDFNNIPTPRAKKHIKILGNVMDLPKGKYDLALAFDVIEHLEKKGGEKLLDWMDKHCKHMLIFVPEEPEGFHRVWADGNVLQNHISYWREEDFTKRGYKVERCPNAHSDQHNGEILRFDALWVSR